MASRMHPATPSATRAEFVLVPPYAGDFEASVTSEEQIDRNNALVSVGWFSKDRLVMALWIASKINDLSYGDSRALKRAKVRRQLAVLSSVLMQLCGRPRVDMAAFRGDLARVGLVVPVRDYLSGEVH